MNASIFRPDTIHADTAHYARPDTARTAHLVRMNNAQRERIDSLESTLATRVTVGLLLLLATLALRVK